MSDQSIQTLKYCIYCNLMNSINNKKKEMNKKQCPQLMKQMK